MKSSAPTSTTKTRTVRAFMLFLGILLAIILLYFNTTTPLSSSLDHSIQNIETKTVENSDPADNSVSSFNKAANQVFKLHRSLAKIFDNLHN